MEQKSPDAFRTISEVADWLGVPTHVLRFWESRFTQVKPVKRAGGRRYYRPADMQLLGGIRKLLHDDGLTIRGVQKLLREQGIKHVAAMSPPLDGAPSNVVSLEASRVSETVQETTEPTEAPVATALGESEAARAPETGDLEPQDTAAGEADPDEPGLEDASEPGGKTAPDAQTDRAPDAPATGETTLAADLPEEASDATTAITDNAFPAPTDAATLDGEAPDAPADPAPDADTASFHTEVTESDDSAIAATHEDTDGDSDDASATETADAPGTLADEEAVATSRADVPRGASETEKDTPGPESTDPESTGPETSAPETKAPDPEPDPAPGTGAAPDMAATQGDAMIEPAEPDEAPDLDGLAALDGAPAIAGVEETGTGAPALPADAPGESAKTTETADAAPTPRSISLPDIPDDPADEALPPRVTPVTPVLRRMRARGLTLPPAGLQALADRLETLARSDHATPPPRGLG